jgi:hypothetical protein
MRCNALTTQTIEDHSQAEAILAQLRDYLYRLTQYPMAGRMATLVQCELPQICTCSDLF